MSEGCDRARGRPGAHREPLGRQGHSQKALGVKKTNQPPHSALGFPSSLSVRASKGRIPPCSSLGLRPHSVTRMGTRLAVPFCSWSRGSRSRLGQPSWAGVKEVTIAGGHGATAQTTLTTAARVLEDVAEFPYVVAQGTSPRGSGSVGNRCTACCQDPRETLVLGRI